MTPKKHNARNLAHEFSLGQSRMTHFTQTELGGNKTAIGNKQGRFLRRNISISSVCNDLQNGKHKRALHKLLLISTKTKAAFCEVVQDISRKEVAEFARKNSFASLSQKSLQDFQWIHFIQQLQAGMPTLYGSLMGAMKTKVTKSELVL